MQKISILMPVYNACQYLSEAIESILNQTYRNFEFIIIDDASKDNSLDILKSYEDPRIVLVENKMNMGVAWTLNRGVSLARGCYIARMDADDISVPKRLERQIRFMESHPEIGIAGGWVKHFGNGLSSIARVPIDPQEVHAYMHFENPLWHMSVIMRKDLLEKFHLQYDSSFSRSEDYDLWTRAIQHFPMANIGEVLVWVREHGGSATRANWGEVTDQTEIIQCRLLERAGLTPSSGEIVFHHRVGRGYRISNRQEIDKAEAWLQRLCNANRESKQIADISFRRAVAVVWLRVCANSGPLGPWIYEKWRNSPLAIGFPQPFAAVARFLASIGWHQCRRLVS
ncbi:MAG: glycosyltransferase [Proteobacteria bacterium]|nr:glycosyltransferase [Pseudomonadota bacterium]